jgi:formylglycine-generating enzyme required for sulfatase activity
MSRGLLCFLFSAVMIFSISPSFAGDIFVRNIKTNFQEKICEVEFDLGWEHSWRTTSGPANWDAAWVFIKYRLPDDTGKPSGNWRHAALSPSSDRYRIKNDNPIPPAFAPSPDGKGVFIFRGKDGQGEISWQGVILPWDIAADKIPLNTKPEVRIFALEMVYVPEGPFFAGDGISPGRIHAGGDPKAPFQVTQNPPKLANEPEGLWVDGSISRLPAGQPAPAPWDNPSGFLPAEFPTGYRAFYIMKYEISQGLYADYLNTLSPRQAQARFPTENEIKSASVCPPPCRYTITVDSSGNYSAAAPSRANIWMNWEDSIAFADWAGLRPMAELEFEKASRGSGQPAVPGEYAWGTTKIITLAGFEGVDGSGTEKATPLEANTSFQKIIQGPVRVGIFEGKPTRELSGASYYGVMDLSGNVVEMAVTIGNAAGRRFTGLHGDGELSEQGFANVPLWPRIPQVLLALGSPDLVSGGFGYRGGDFWNPELDLRVSARNVATFPGARRLFGLGFRAVRSAF